MPADRRSGRAAARSDGLGCCNSSGVGRVDGPAMHAYAAAAAAVAAARDRALRQKGMTCGSQRENTER